MTIPFVGLGIGCIIVVIVAVHLLTDNKPDATSNTGAIKFSVSTIVAVIVAALILLAVAWPHIAATWQQLGGK